MNRLWFFLVFLLACSNPKHEVIVHNIGFAQGTTYSIKYSTDPTTDFQFSIDSIFAQIDSSLSTYVPFSFISKINQHQLKQINDSHFLSVFERSQQISKQTNGAFDATINPLIDLWGFGGVDTLNLDSLMVKKQLKNCGFSEVYMQDSLLVMPPSFSLNFNAIAQGYTVDVIAQFLEQKNITNYLIEVGGELRASGTNGDRGWWKIGIDKPQKKPDPSDRFQVVITLQNKALATSGNYRNFYIKDEQIYSHTIDPISGFPVQHNLLSATVLADDCMSADAYATAFMIMGLDSTIAFLQSHPELEAFLIYGENQQWESWSTSGFDQLIVD